MVEFEDVFDDLFQEGGGHRLEGGPGSWTWIPPP
jgi:hypothetical protein